MWLMPLAAVAAERCWQHEPLVLPSRYQRKSHHQLHSWCGLVFSSQECKENTKVLFPWFQAVPVWHLAVLFCSHLGFHVRGHSWRNSSICNLLQRKTTTKLFPEITVHFGWNYGQNRQSWWKGSQCTNVTIAKLEFELLSFLFAIL